MITTELDFWKTLEPDKIHDQLERTVIPLRYRMAAEVERYLQCKYIGYHDPYHYYKSAADLGDRVSHFEYSLISTGNVVPDDSDDPLTRALVYAHLQRNSSDRYDRFIPLQDTEPRAMYEVWSTHRDRGLAKQLLRNRYSPAWAEIIDVYPIGDPLSDEAQRLGVLFKHTGITRHFLRHNQDTIPIDCARIAVNHGYQQTWILVRLKRGPISRAERYIYGQSSCIEPDESSKRCLQEWIIATAHSLKGHLNRDERSIILKIMWQSRIEHLEGLE